MKGHIRRRGKRSWAIVFDLGRDSSGRRRQKWHTVHGTKCDAERELTRLLNDRNTGAYVEPSRMTVREYLQQWLKDCAQHTVSPKTFERYEEIINGHVSLALGGVKLCKLQPLQIQAFYSEALVRGRKDGSGGLSAQTVLHFHRVLHKALGQAVKWQLLVRNPADAVQAPRPDKKEMLVLNEHETSQLLENLEGGRLHMPVALAVSLGLRRGEILALRWQDIEFDTGKVTIRQSLEQTGRGLRFKEPKTYRSRRYVTLPSFTVEILRRHKIAQAKERLSLGPAYVDHDLICPRADGKPWAPASFSAEFTKMIRRTDLPQIRFHDLRHTHATQLLRQGVHPKIVSERLGHSKVGLTLDTYSHVVPGMQEEAAQKIDAVLGSAIRKNQRD